MKNPLGLSIIGSAVIAILCGIAGANYQPKDGNLDSKAAVQATSAAETTPVDATATPAVAAP